MAHYDFKLGNNVVSTTPIGAAAMFATPFGRIKTSTAVTSFQSKFIYDRDLLRWEEKTTGGGAITGPTRSLVTISVVNAGRAVRQTHEYIAYIPGKTQTTMMSGILHTAAPTGAIFRIGSYDSTVDKTSVAPDVNEANGHFFEANNTTGTIVYNVVQRSSRTGVVVDERIARSSWNVDKLDGTGRSRVTIDFTKANVFSIDRPWLGVGSVRLGILYNGMFIACHEFLNESAFAAPYIERATLPIRYEIDSTAVISGTATMGQICCTVQTENGYDPVGYSFSLTKTTILTNNATIPIAAIRVNPAFPRVQLLPEKLSACIYSTGSAIIYINVYYGTTVTGGTWAAESSTGYTQSNTTFTSITGGRLVSSIPVTTSYTIDGFIFDKIQPITTDISGTIPDTFVIQCIVVGTIGPSGNSGVSLSWTELI